jgi:predicted permease
MGPFLTALLPVVALVALGRFLAWRQALPEAGWRGVERLSYLVLFPALVVRELARAPFDGAPLRMAGVLIGAQLVMGLAGWAAHRAGLVSGPASGSLIQSNVRWNTFIGLALAGALMGAEGVALVALAAAALTPTANVISVFALSHYAARGVDAPRPRPFAELARNPLILACALGLGLNMAGLAPSGPVDATLALMGQCTIALGLLTAGAGVDLSALRAAGVRTGVWSVFRLLAFPAVAVGAALGLGLPAREVGVIAIATATPTATSGYVLARQLGGDLPFTANLIALQTVLAVLTLPLVWWVVQGILG